MSTPDAMVALMARVRLHEIATETRIERLERAPVVRPGLYTLAEAATRLGCSRDFLRGHQDCYRVRRLEPGKTAKLYFPSQFIEDVIAGKAEPEFRNPVRRRSRMRKPRTDLLELKGGGRKRP